MRRGVMDLVQADTILIAVSDGVLADSLRFSLELEGFETQFCDEQSLGPAVNALAERSCTVLDQNMFTRMNSGGACGFSHMGSPVVLIVSRKTKDLLTRAEAAGVTAVVEEPLVGGVLFEAIRQVVSRDKHPRQLPPQLRSFP